MHTPPLPTGDGHSSQSDRGNGPLGNGAPPPSSSSKPADDADVADLFTPDAEPTDDTPTVISRNPPRPASSEDVFSGTLRGRKLAHFELIEPIGVGGMAAVIRARDLQLERQVALKILPPEMAADPENIRRFQQEARSAARLDHENIARVFFCGEDQKLHFIAFEFVEGQNLRTVIERRDRLPVPEAIHYMLQVASGLSHASDRGVIHRDIKPSNIIITPSGRAKLVDMGLARQLDLHRDQGLTQSGVTLGTLDYISPEQALEPRDADVRSDIYSLGCTFYHALTGQAPVPEGTAAKKLHHHQQVAPVDPRQLNPDVPDEVAAILGRMMAKEPKDRYQRPEHLVQHLMQVAQKLGASVDVPDGLLFVDAPLPSPPRPRPLLLGAIAAVAVVTLVVLLGQSPPRVTSPQLVRGTATESNPSEGGTQPPQPPGPTPQPPGTTVKPVEPPGNTNVAAHDEDTYEADEPQAKDVNEFLRGKAAQPDKARTVKLTADLNLENPDGTVLGLVCDAGEGSKIVIAPKEGKPRPTIRLRYPATGRASLWAALTVKSGTVTLRGLRFIIDAAESPGSTLDALQCLGGRLEVEDCVFIQDKPSLEPSRLSTLEVRGTNGATPAITFTRCCFLNARREQSDPKVADSQQAITLTGGGSVKLTDCAFGPHAALIAYQGDRLNPVTRAQVELNHCSALLAGEAAVVRLKDVQACSLTARNCLFSWPKGPSEDRLPPKAVLVRQVEDSSASFSWSGSDNRYHNFDSFWLRRPGEVALALEEFREKVKEIDVKEEASSQELVSAAPWKEEDPLQLLDGQDPIALRKAFAVNVERAELRQGNKHLIGIEQFTGSDEPYTRNLAALEKKPEPSASRKLRTVDPHVKETKNGVYPSLAQALDGAQAGDEIQLRWNGPHEVPEPIRLLRANLDVLIQPAAGYRPILVLGGTDPEDEEAALFRLHDGKLRLEQLHFHLRPAPDKAKAQTVVALVGEGECTFDNCLVTLEQLASVPLSAVLLPELPRAMKMENKPVRPLGQRAHVTFRNCLVRGDGDLLSTRGGRPFDLDVENALLALGGSFLNVEGAGDDLPAELAGASASVRLKHATVYLVGYLARFHAVKDLKGLLPVHFKEVSECLFAAPPDRARALIHLDGPEASEDKMKVLLTWEGRHNAYSGFPQMLEQQPGDGSMPAMPYNQDKWKEFTHERDGVYNSVKVADPPATEVLSRSLPARFRAKAEPDQQGYGADVEQLPKPPETIPRSEK